MARKQEPVHGLVPSAPDDILRKIRSWHLAENPSPLELRAWINDMSQLCKQAVVLIHSNAEHIRKLRENTRLEALAARNEAVDFVERGEVALNLLDGVTAGRVSDAFVEGLRLGMIHDKLLSIIDGRYRERWVQQDRRKRGVKKANDAREKKRPDYKAAVAAKMASMLYTPACAEVAQEFDCTPETVRNNTPELRPRKPKGK